MSEYERIWENEVAELRDKIERLRADKAELLAAVAASRLIQIGQMADEIERLRTDKAELLAAAKDLLRDHEQFWGATPGGWKSAETLRAIIAKVGK